MKAQLLSKFIDQSSSFVLENHAYKNFLKVWHYHPELELVIILQSTGTRFVGDSIEKFEPGEIVLLGENLPHLWLNDRIYFEKNTNLIAEACVIHFQEDFAGGLFKIPEMAYINDLFERAKRGIKFSGKSNKPIIKSINDMFSLRGYDKLMKFLQVLKCLSGRSDFKILSSTGYINTFREINNSKMVRIHEFIMNNFKKDISLCDVAELANMNPSAFSRYFKSIQKKTFIRFLNEVRIGYACKLLIEDKYNIGEVCFESGFNNISNFNRQFKSLKKISPSKYIKIYEGLN
ncbi:MAG: AraC family transcriptional regulator [Anditalea sp.]